MLVTAVAGSKEGKKASLKTIMHWRPGCVATENVLFRKKTVSER